MKKRVLAMLLCLCMAVTMLPTAALADDVTSAVTNGPVPIGATGTVDGGTRAYLYSADLSYSLTQNEDKTYTLTLSSSGAGVIPSYTVEEYLTLNDGQIAQKSGSIYYYVEGGCSDRECSSHRNDYSRAEQRPTVLVYGNQRVLSGAALVRSKEYFQGGL